MHFLIGAISTALKRAWRGAAAPFLLVSVLPKRPPPPRPTPTRCGGSSTTAASLISMRVRARNPARRSTPAASASEDVAILKDLVGVAQMLAIPTRRITGIEDPQMLAARRAAGLRRRLEGEDPGRGGGSAAGRCRARRSRWRSIPSTPAARSSCTSTSIASAADVVKALADYAPSLDDQWRAMTVALEGRKYLARRLFRTIFSGRSRLLRLLADGTARTPKGDMGAMSLGVVGANSTASRGSSSSPTFLRSRAAATPRTSRTTIAQSPERAP